MKLAVTYENGDVFQHFGHTEKFKVYDIKDGRIINSEIVDTNGNGHGALAGVLQNIHADKLICGGIGGGAQMALLEAGIELIAGVSGNCDDAVNKYLSGSLAYGSTANCSHHDAAHGSGEHKCGDHGCRQ